MASSAEIMEAAKAMVLLGREHSQAGKPMPSRTEEARAALEAAERVRDNFLSEPAWCGWCGGTCKCDDHD